MTKPWDIAILLHPSMEVLQNQPHAEIEENVSNRISRTSATWCLAWLLHSWTRKKRILHQVMQDGLVMLGEALWGIVMGSNLCQLGNFIWSDSSLHHCCKECCIISGHSREGLSQHSVER